MEMQQALDIIEAVGKANGFELVNPESLTFIRDHLGCEHLDRAGYERLQVVWAFDTTMDGFRKLLAPKV